MNLLLLRGILLNRKSLETPEVAALFFSLTSSFIYVLNDFKDVVESYFHSLKCFCSLTAGTITVSTASVLGSVSMALGLFLVWGLNMITDYLGSILRYVYIINQWVLFDLMAISVGGELFVVKHIPEFMFHKMERFL